MRVGGIPVESERKIEEEARAPKKLVGAIRWPRLTLFARSRKAGLWSTGAVHFLGVEKGKKKERKKKGQESSGAPCSE